MTSATQGHNDGAEHLTASVAGNLRRLRAEHDLTLDELAKRAGVSRAMLHQIESGKSTPTIALLWKIAAGLDVPFSTLIDEPARTTTTLLRRANAKLLFNSDQTFSSRALFPFDGSRRSAEFYELRISPGGLEQAEAHAPGTSENLVLVSGGPVEVEVAGTTHKLEANDVLVFTADVAHSYRNIGKKDEAQLYLMMTYRSG